MCPCPPPAPPPANGNAHDQRGAECPLRLHGPVGEGIRFALSTSGLIMDDPDDAGIKCLPHWLVEGLLSRVARLGAPAALGPGCAGLILQCPFYSIISTKVWPSVVKMMKPFDMFKNYELIREVDADVLLMDEPFSAVDEQTRRKFQEDLLHLLRV